MSAGAFIPSVYESNTGVFWAVRIQPETLGLVLNSTTNAAATGTPLAVNPSAKVSGGLREIGVICRRVRFKFSTTVVPTGYKPDSILVLPVLTVAAFNAYGKGSTGTYLLDGTAFDVAFVGKTPERIN